MVLAGDAVLNATLCRQHCPAYHGAMNTKLSTGFAAIAVIATLAVSPAAAQTPPDSRYTPTPPPVEFLIELADILGQAHAIRTVCNGEGDQTWRAYMMEMMSIEAPGGRRRSELTRAFNQGYRTQSRRTRSCTSDLAQIEAQLAARGRMLSDTITRIYLE